jgi:hypothetical protein
MYQCEGKTQSGSRCKRNTYDVSKRCHQHLHSDKYEIPSATSAPSVSSVPTTRTNPVTHSRSTTQTRSFTRNLIELLRLGDEETFQLLFELELEREARESRVREPPRRPRPRPKQRKESQTPKEVVVIDDDETIEQYKGHVEDCCICMDSKVKEIDFLECKHAVCRGCVHSLRDPRCPMCRADIKAHFITEKDRNGMKAKARQDKMDRADEAFRSYIAQQRVASYLTI